MTESSGTKHPLDFMNTGTETTADDVVPEAWAIRCTGQLGHFSPDSSNESRLTAQPRTIFTASRIV